MVCSTVSKALSASTILVSIFRNEPEPEIHNSPSTFTVILMKIFRPNNIPLVIRKVTLVDQRTGL